jgi:hypothetical protein
MECIVNWNYLPSDKPKNLSHKQIKESIQSAAKEWNSCLAGLVKFVEGYGELQVRFAFDAKINKKLHPERIGECRQLKNPTSWEISFDTREKWNVGGMRKFLGIGYDLRSTALHEFGHIIDLPHALRYDFIMHKDYNEQIELNKDEIKSYREHYIVMNDFA